ncbi:MAG TPA: hypothetical protein VKS78_15945 [Roseiarcus sp.]|nr:hypothetical protein [Roseiarcus sp.]
MRKLALLVAAAAAISTAALATANAQTGWNDGCYRLGLTGYHWYNFCVGPDFAYPHRRVCERGGFCWYR